HDFVMGDICPQWHAATRVVLATGKTFGFDGGVKENRGFERVSYAVFDPAKNRWSELKLLALPEKDREGKTILEPNAGCHQRHDLPNGEILLPIRYRKDPKTRVYTTIVARCSFDGETLTYREHGSEFNIAKPRGLYEPSVCGFQGRYFLTMRAEETGYVARGKDGMNYEPFVEWTFDDGKPLGSYNAQQHWIAHRDALYLIYSRRGANNDHVFRNRAPLFIARVDPERLCVLRDTEQILMPETGLDLAGGFAPVDVSADETWVISSEMAFPKNRSNEPNRVLLAKILWSQPATSPGSGARAGETIENSIGLKLIRIPAGEFTMGSPSSENGRRDDEPQRQVRLTRDFFIGRCEVTRGQFRRFVDATGYRTEAERNVRGGYGFDEQTRRLSGPDKKFSWRFTGFAQTDEHPVVNVSWNDASAFCHWLTHAERHTYRLPTEAEWEYACRGGATTAYCNGDDPQKLIAVGNILDAPAKEIFPDRIAIAGNDGFVFTAPVGSFRPNAFGLCDMHGNVWEWCADWFGPPMATSQIDPRGPDHGKDKVIRGGDWYHDWAFARSAQRFPIHPTLCRRHAGFRVVREVSP
ncbi:MAG TPA: formylglycine-generating enzyme family protein, partial [Verrucomicrobiae bacterium]